jgi:hypothetical protein
MPYVCHTRLVSSGDAKSRSCKREASALVGAQQWTPRTPAGLLWVLTLLLAHAVPLVSCSGLYGYPLCQGLQARLLCFLCLTSSKENREACRHASCWRIRTVACWRLGLKGALRVALSGGQGVKPLRSPWRQCHVRGLEPVPDGAVGLQTCGCDMHVQVRLRQLWRIATEEEMSVDWLGSVSGLSCCWRGRLLLAGCWRGRLLLERQAAVGRQAAVVLLERQAVLACCWHVCCEVV